MSKVEVIQIHTIQQGMSGGMSELVKNVSHLWGVLTRRPRGFPIDDISPVSIRKPKT